MTPRFATQSREERSSVDLDQYKHEGPIHAERASLHAAAGQVVKLPAPIAPPRVVATPAARSAVDVAFDGKLVVDRDVPADAVEHYRQLASALLEIQERSAWSGHAAVERGLKTILVTSALPREGRTLTAVNLALTLSASYGRRVLLVDADLHRPSVHEAFGLSNTVGVSEFLTSATPQLSLQELSPGLSVAVAGRAERRLLGQLASDRMRAFLEECSPRFDWILLDAPAVSVMPNPHLLARLARAVLFVVASGSTPSRLVERAIADVGRSCLLGTVLNAVESW